MPKFIRRNCLRNYNGARISWTNRGHKNRHSARMLNKSVKGMYFEASRKIEPGTEIIIQLGDTRKNVPQRNHNRIYKAKVRWCKPAGQSLTDHICYGVGVQYISSERGNA